MAENDKEEKKIIVDDDWKKEAQQEKEALSQEQKADGAEKQRPSLPPADFAGLVSLLATQAFFAMGLLRNEEDKDRPVDLSMAKYNIDMLEIIEQKTKGNLSEDEEKLLGDTLHQLRMAFVKLSE